MKMPEDVLKKFFDSHVSYQGANENEGEKFTFDYKFLIPPRGEDSCPAEKIPLTEEKQVQVGSI